MSKLTFYGRRLFGFGPGMVVLVSLVSFFQPAVAAEPVPWPSFFHAEGRHLVADANGSRCLFRGVNLPGLEYGAFFDNPYPGSLGGNFFQPEAQDLAQVAAWGFNCVRVPFEWGRLVPGYQVGTPVSLNAAYLGLLDQVVGWAAARQLYVILDMHDYLKYWSGSSQQVFVDNEPVYQTFLAETWRQTAAHYAANPAVLGYEVMNEPARYDGPGTGSDSNWHAIAQAVIHAIRTADTNHLILVDGRNYSLPGIWQRDNGSRAFVHDEISPPRLAYCPHVYFDANGDSRYEEGGAPAADWYYYVRDRLLPVLDWAETNNVPVMITESGIPNTAAWAALLSAVFADFFEPLRISNVYWLYDPRHSSSELQLAANGYQLAVLRSHPGGTYTDLQPAHLTYRQSPLYDGALVRPWSDASWLAPGDEIDFGAQLPGTPSQRVIRVSFTNGWSGLKFYHDYLDTRRYATLQFKIRGGTTGGQDLWLFTENLHFQESSKTNLNSYVLPDNETRIVAIPLSDLVPPDDPVITSVVFQNIDHEQPAFFIWDIVLLPSQSPLPVSDHPIAADFDGDRFADPALVTSNGWYVWFSSGNYARQGPFALTRADAMPMAADFDGDSLADPAMVGNTSLTVWLSSGNYASITTERFLIPGATPMGGDVDGDRLADPVAYTPDGWTVWLSRSGYTAFGPFAFVQANATAQLGDFDGDHLADPALVTSSGWTILLSGTGYLAFGPYPMVVAGGIPIAADFDGDSLADPAMYNDGIWTIWLSGQGYAGYQWTNDVCGIKAECDGGKVAIAWKRRGWGSFSSTLTSRPELQTPTRTSFRR